MAMQQYLIISPNPGFNGKLGGLEFHKGKTILNQETLPANLGRTVDQTIKLLEEQGCTIKSQGVLVSEAEYKMPTAQSPKAATASQTKPRATTPRTVSPKVVAPKGKTITEGKFNAGLKNKVKA